MGGALLAASHAVATPDISLGHLLVQMVVAMGIIIGGIWGFSKLVGRSRAAGQRAGRKAGTFLRQRGNEHGLTILSRQPLGKGKCLAVVQVGTQQFLVGIADSGLTPLGELRTVEVGQGTPHDVAVPTAAVATGIVGSGLGELAHSAFSVPRSATGTFAFESADLEGIDLRALAAGAAGASGSGQAPQRRQPDGAAQAASRSVRGWVDALREATVRR